MEIKLPYGKSEMSLTVPEDIELEFLREREPAVLEDLPRAFRGCCEQPLASPPLSEMARSAGNVVILVSDITRSGGMEAVLPLCVEYLDELGIGSKRLKIIVARGTHRKLTKEERAVFRRAPLANIVLEQHDCDDTEKLSALLLTKRATPVRVNLALKDAGLIIILAPISFHYFAGFGGGRKLVLPGCADRHAILANHRLSLVDGKNVRLHPSCRPGVLEGNPVHEDMCETVAALKRVFAVNFFADVNRRIVFLNAGEVLRSHEQACAAYREAHSTQVNAPYEVVILSAGGHPFDINFLQSHKPIRHAAAAIKKGGAVLYFAECAEGMGSPSLEGALKQKKEDFLKLACKQYDLNNQTAVSLYDLTDRYQIGMVSSADPAVLAACGIQPVSEPESFLSEALERRRAHRAAVIAHGHSILPVPKAGGNA